MFTRLLTSAVLLTGAFAGLGRGDDALLSASPVHSIRRIEAREWPRLRDEFTVIGQPTRAYNCIAWSIGVTDRWMWPGPRVADFDALYAKSGFTRIGRLDYGWKAGEDKIVLYATLQPDGRVKACTHAARQMADGSWTNKLGAMALIRVATPDHLDGPTYGSPVAVYVRRRDGYRPTETSPAGAQNAPLQTNRYYRVQNTLSGKVLTGSRDSLTQTDYSGASRQQWRIKVLANGAPVLENRATGTVLTASGGTLRLRPLTGDSHQQWVLDRDGRTVKIRSQADNQVLDVERGSQANGGRVLLWPAHGNSNQQWEFIPVEER